MAAAAVMAWPSPAGNAVVALPAVWCPAATTVPGVAPLCRAAALELALAQARSTRQRMRRWLSVSLMASGRGAGQASMWCHSELVMAIELGKRVYSLDLAPDLLPHPLLASLQGIRYSVTIDAGIQRLATSLASSGLSGDAWLGWERGRPPYPGLTAMDVADAGVFFGRAEEVRDLLARVDDPLGQPGGDLVVVMGSSGAGKSSIVRAGLSARLAAPGSGWAVAGPFEPGTRPLDRLASRLAAWSRASLPVMSAASGCWLRAWRCLASGWLIMRSLPRGACSSRWTRLSNWLPLPWVGSARSSWPCWAKAYARARP
jgi:hypothetical protein